ncbi:MAG: 4Fe-4S cluster-binding domain-containing protein [Candidatus Lokiarchaeota archaeon]|nr:4Fe-4S cluster-binding domain-containing protein [Candidatus Lokiarchaeota archaeon]
MSYLSEVFSSIQGEGGTIQGSCFGKHQIFIRYSGCNIAQKRFGTDGCFWCDSIESQYPKPKKFWYEKLPNSKQKTFSNNPVKIPELIEIIRNLVTKDLHSISFTGGEPLFQLKFLLELAYELNNQSEFKYPLYLETNGSLIPNNSQYEHLGKFFSFCCCDIKDRSSQAAEPARWDELVNNELEFIRNLIFNGVKTFAKIVVTSETQIQDIEWIAEELFKIKYQNGDSVGLAIQPVFLENQKLKQQFSISTDHLNQLFYAAAKYIEPKNLTLSIQAHKHLNLL